MVGKTYKVLFTRLAHRRRKEVYHFELSLNGQAYARRVQKAIGEASKKLETFPQAFPNYTYHDTDFEIKYTKALDYKILFRVMKDSSEVIILSIRNDA